MTRRDDIREKALKDLQQYQVLMLNGHFDFGNGYHGTLYLNPHQLFRYPSTIWRFAQDLLDVAAGVDRRGNRSRGRPGHRRRAAGHTIAGLLDSRRDHCPPADLVCAVHAGRDCRPTLYAVLPAPRRRPEALVVDDVRNTGQTQARCVELLRKAGGTVIATAEIYDRMESIIETGVPNFALAEYKAPDNYPADACPFCKAGTPVTTF